jgi:hypothetical protein
MDTNTIEIYAMLLVLIYTCMGLCVYYTYTMTEAIHYALNKKINVLQSEHDEMIKVYDIKFSVIEEELDIITSYLDDIINVIDAQTDQITENSQDIKDLQFILHKLFASQLDKVKT